MPRTPTDSPPSYRLHKASGQAVVTVRHFDGGRQDVYLGPHGSPESHQKYARLLAEWSAGRTPGPKLIRSPSGPSLAEVLLRFLDHAEVYYRYPDGAVTPEVWEFKRVIRDLRETYAGLPAADFSPLCLKAVRQRMIDAGLVRTVINQRVGRVKRIFKWAAAEELVPPSVYHGLQAVAGLQAGRSGARESDKVLPVAWDVVEATLPHLNPIVRDMALLQWHSGARPGEVCRLRPADIETPRDRGGVWLYHVPGHKTQRFGKRRVVVFGPRAREVLAARLRPDEPSAPVFRPADAVRGRDNVCGRPLRAHYTAQTYNYSVRRACRKAGVPHWHVHQLRHAFATRANRRFGIEEVQTALGHAQLHTTEVYAERDLAAAVRVALELG